MYILAIDQSTAGTKAILFTANGELVSRTDIPHRQITNEKGWVEHDPVEIYKNTVKACKKVVEESKIDKSLIKAVGISNQRETAVCWNKETGEPVYNALVWQCGRAAYITDEIKKAGKDELVRRVTGLNLSPFFSAPKFAWIVRNVSEARELLQDDKLYCGNIDAWLLYKLTEGKEFKTDYSNASRTELLNLDTLQWDKDMVELFGIKESALPTIQYSDSIFGYTTLEGLFDAPTPIHAIMGDSHSALYANGCHSSFTAKATFGTGTSVMMNAGLDRPKVTSKGVVESLAWGIEGKVNYSLEGNINYSGAIIKWLVDDIKLIANAKESEEIAATTESTNGVYLIPAFSGLGAPYWNNEARAILCGMSASTKKEHIVRAGLEAIAFQIKDIVEELNTCCRNPLHKLSVDGGATKNQFLMQFVADILNVDLAVSQIEELSAAGVAYLASIASGCATSETIFARDLHTPMKPIMASEQREKNYEGWKNAVNMLLK
ncbi:MAG: glycerol kinase [Herbinix sp.]|jgi:glycerol kinase|nr:glycerol kinase [Herbinix sp.]